MAQIEILPETVPLRPAAPAEPAGVVEQRSAVLFATVWSRFFRRGPLEYLLNSVTKLAKFVR